MWLSLMVIKAIIDPQNTVKHEEEYIKSSVVRRTFAEYKLEEWTESNKNELTYQIHKIVQKRLKKFEKSILKHCESWCKKPTNAEA